MADEPRVRRSIEVQATPEEVWRMIVEPDALSAWFGGSARLDVRPGGTGRLTADDGEVRLAVVEEVEAPRRLVFSWWPLHGADGTPPGPHDRSRVTITIDAGESDSGDAEGAGEGDRAGVRIHVDEEVVALARRPVPTPTIGIPGRGAGTRPGLGARARASSPVLAGARA